MTTDEGSAYKRQTVGFGAILPQPPTNSENDNLAIQATSPGSRLWQARAAYTLSAVGLAGSNIIYSAASIYGAFRQTRTPYFITSACQFFDDQIRANCGNAREARRELIARKETRSGVSVPVPPQ